MDGHTATICQIAYEGAAAADREVLVRHRVRIAGERARTAGWEKLADVRTVIRDSLIVDQELCVRALLCGIIGAGDTAEWLLGVDARPDHAQHRER